MTTTNSRIEKRVRVSLSYSLVKRAFHSQEFHYNPLDPAQQEIRLLILYGSHPSAPRSGQAELRIVPLGLKPTYEALSYQWGTSLADRSIIINGQHKAITPNLDLALRSLRYEMLERVLWVDAICIDQTSMKEKSTQVQLMNRIYTEANEVLIWLGRPEYSLRALSANNAERRAFDTITRFKGNPSRIRREGTMPTLHVSQRLGYDDLVGISYICTRKYWTRIWIIQEVGLARRSTIYCCYDQGPDFTAGDEVCSASWDSFIDAVDQAEWQHSPESSVPMDAVTRRLLQDISQSLPAQMGRRKGKLRASLQSDLPTLSHLLEISQNSESQRRQDRVFGLLGFSEDCQGKLLANYSKSPYEIYNSVMEFYNTEVKHGKFEDARLVRLSRILQRNLGLDSRRWRKFPSSNHVFVVPGMVTGVIKGFCAAWDGRSAHFESPGPLLRSHVPDSLYGSRLHSGLINNIAVNDLKRLLRPFQCSKMSIERPHQTPTVLDHLYLP
ncbi:heterokaryon incompatibility protein-domain-containing protein [Cadophora sp. MPI-SDFR-AT-0126]|nr:heterokaryon incompatibility protein-domain-containing protein [Leotiomycetes sp. MPI-SDFR-AT-0126]